MTSYVDFFLPPKHYHVLVDLGGKFSDKSTVVFQGFSGGRPSYVNMRNLSNRNAVVTNAIIGPGHDRWIRLTQQIQEYDALRIVCTRLAPGDEIRVEAASSGTPRFDIDLAPVHATLDSWTQVQDLEAPHKMFSPFQIHEEADLFDSLQGVDDI